jgi:hypothetical protein
MIASDDHFSINRGLFAHFADGDNARGERNYYRKMHFEGASGSSELWKTQRMRLSCCRTKLNEFCNTGILQDHRAWGPDDSRQLESSSSSHSAELVIPVASRPPPFAAYLCGQPRASGQSTIRSDKFFELSSMHVL